MTLDEIAREVSTYTGISEEDLRAMIANEEWLGDVYEKLEKAGAPKELINELEWQDTTLLPFN